VIGYGRVSTEEQTASGAGLGAQRTAIEAEVARRGWDLASYIEDGCSGAKAPDEREWLSLALLTLREGRADILMVAKLDRLSRSLYDFAGLMERSRREGWALVALDLGVDTTTPAGEAMASVMATFAQMERRLIGQRTREALAIKRTQGVRIGRPRTLPDAVMARIIAEREKGASLQAIADRLTAEGVATSQGGQRWYASTVRAVLMTAEREADLARIRADLVA
jgi:DNA invertase Pin-like site-specific DNA recombinase